MNEVELTRSTPIAEPTSEGVLPLLQLISVLVEKRCDKFLSAKYGLTSPQYQLLLAALRNSEMTLGGLSEQLNCSRGNVTGIVDRLERDEWLRRERSNEDRRVITVKLTEKGDRIHVIQRQLTDELSALAHVWDDEQRQILTGMLQRMYRELKE
jgi:DNA-binding MarR family transcriptional regulator